MTEIADAAADFAAMMGKAADAADTKEDAPYGYTTDPDGTVRPKKAAGRPRKPPSLDELKEQKAAQAAEDGAQAAAPAADRPPERPRGRRRKQKAGSPDESRPAPQFREGQIEKGVNRLYRKAGKIVRVADAEIGQAIIDATRAEDEDDITVGKAWEELCRHNPRLRRVVLKCLKGGAYGQLFWAHAPILLAILMKDAIRRHIPFSKLMETFLEHDEDGEAPADGTPMEGLTPDDMNEAVKFAQQMMGQMLGKRIIPGQVVPRPPEAPETDGEAA